MSYAATETVVDRPTSRQLEILDLMADGLPDKLIAARLGISVRCVRAHAPRQAPTQLRHLDPSRSAAASSMRCADGSNPPGNFSNRGLRDSPATLFAGRQDRQSDNTMVVCMAQMLSAGTTNS